jgi:hypothetical protein
VTDRQTIWQQGSVTVLPSKVSATWNALLAL